MTVVDSDIAQLNKTHYPDLDISMDVSFPQRASCRSAPGKEWLADSVDAWFAGESPQRTNADLLKRYFEQTKRACRRFPSTSSKGYISRYDNIFKEVRPDSWLGLAPYGRTGFR